MGRVRTHADELRGLAVPRGNPRPERGGVGSSAIHVCCGSATRHRLPAVYPFRFHMTGGGLISYGPDLNELRRAARYVDRILKMLAAGEPRNSVNLTLDQQRIDVVAPSSYHALNYMRVYELFSQIRKLFGFENLRQPKAFLASSCDWPEPFSLPLSSPP